MRNPLTRRPSPRTRPRVILHIGRNKAASTTIQDCCLAARQDFAVQGVTYVLFGHLKDSHLDVPGFQTFEELAVNAAAHPEQTYLVSNEFMFAWPDAYTQAAARALSACDVTIIAYLRPYDAWVRSAYAEETRRGMNRRDIDRYLEDMRGRISSWPALEMWARCFGWDRVRVRTLEPAALAGGDVLSDFAYAIGVSRPMGFAPPSNVSPHWLELELARALAPADRDTEWTAPERLAVEPLIALMAESAASMPDIPYLTLDQRQALAVLYDQDTARIEAATGQRMSRSSKVSGPERSFLPSLAVGPPPLLRRYFEAVRSKSFADLHPEAAARARDLGDMLLGA